MIFTIEQLTVSSTRIVLSLSSSCETSVDDRQGFLRATQPRNLLLPGWMTCQGVPCLSDGTIYLSCTKNIILDIMMAKMEAGRLPGPSGLEGRMRVLATRSINPVVAVTTSSRVAKLKSCKIHHRDRNSGVGLSLSGSAATAWTSRTSICGGTLNSARHIGVSRSRDFRRLPLGLQIRAASSGMACQSPEPAPGYSQPVKLLVALQMVAMSCVLGIFSKFANVMETAKRVIYFTPSEEDAMVRHKQCFHECIVSICQVACAVEPYAHMEFMQALNNKVRTSWKQMRTLAVVAPFAAASSSGGATTMILLTAAVASFIKVMSCFLPVVSPGWEIW
jgi:hypothetical protein